MSFKFVEKEEKRIYSTRGGLQKQLKKVVSDNWGGGD